MTRLPLDECKTWAVRPETMSVIASVITHGVSDAQFQAAVERNALRAQPKPKAPGVAVIPLQGLITPKPSLLSILFGGGGGLEEFRANLREALADPEVGSILLDVDSRGGSTDLVAETAAEIRQARARKPITAIANTMAGSAGYYLAAQAGELVVTPSGDVGSIGVFCVHEDWTAFNEKFGVQSTYVSAGKYKTELNPDAPLSDDARSSLQTRVDELYAMFLDDVAKGRGSTAAHVRDAYGEGRMVGAQRAVEMGMADRVDTFERTLVRLASEAHGSASAGTAAVGSNGATFSATFGTAPDIDDEPEVPETPEAPDPAVTRVLLERPQH